MLHYPRRFAQRGFTLVEMAIVLVIVGLLLGGVLKGQELIENARVKDAANLFNGVVTAYNGYIDRYGRLPGDDGPLTGGFGTFSLALRGGPFAHSAMTAGNNDGVIDITVEQTFTNGGEQAAFWQHLRAAGLLKGEWTNTTISALPRTSWGGLVGVTNAQVHGYPVPTLMICLRGVPGKAALALDRQLDDGLGGGGNIRATAGNNVNPGGLSNYNEVGYYTVCQKI